MFNLVGTICASVDLNMSGAVRWLFASSVVSSMIFNAAQKWFMTCVCIWALHREAVSSPDSLSHISKGRRYIQVLLLLTLFGQPKISKKLRKCQGTL